MELWKGNDQVFRGYAKGDGKSPAMKVKGKNLLSWSDVENESSFGAILNTGFVDISFDSNELSSKFWDMAEKNSWNCLILENPSNGHIHSYWKDTKGRIDKGGKDKKLSVGLVADIHSGSTYIPLRVHGVNRFPPSFEPDTIDEVPDELIPVNTQIDLLNLSEGEGRNEELFKYILILQGQLLLDKDGIRRVLQNTNDFVFSEPLKQDELDVITRDEAFEKPSFYQGKVFLHNAFGQYMKNEFHITKVDGKLHIYQDGIYHHDLISIEKAMIKVIPTLQKTKRKEVLDYLDIVCDEVSPSPPEKIAFRNGVYDLSTDTLLPFSPDHIITNMIPWDYNPSAYSELCDKTLNKIACYDPEIRSLLEECIGYCFFRENRIHKAFIFVGDKSNGKSTFIGILNKILGDYNISALDLKNLGDRFSTASIYKKLANIGDDISDDFISDSSLFKKITSGDKIKGEQKGQAEFFFNPYVKLVFSANNVPRIKDKTGAVIRRLVIVPFNARFSEEDADFDPNIKYKLCQTESIEYLINIGVIGLKRVLKNKKFTKSGKAQKELDEYEEFNNPVIGFFKEQAEGYLFRQEAKIIYLAYQTYCSENGFLPESKNQFGRTLKSMYGVESKPKTIGGKTVRMYVEITQ